MNSIKIISSLILALLAVSIIPTTNILENIMAEKPLKMEVLMSTDITSSEWDSLISDKKLVAADFWAPWCPYCKLLKPVFESIANEYDKSNIKFGSVNLRQYSSLLVS